MSVIVVWMQVLEWRDCGLRAVPGMLPAREFEATVLITGACPGTLVGMEAR